MKVANMNTAFGNPKGNYYNLNQARLRAQSLNIGYEFIELLDALGMSDYDTTRLRNLMDEITKAPVWSNPVNLLETRDALCDIQVFAMGSQHFMGVNGDDDMTAVIAGVMTRFIKDEADEHATQQKHRLKGVFDVYFEGVYPTKVMKSASDQPDAPKGKFLKSASFSETVFPTIHPTPGEALCARV